MLKLTELIYALSALRSQLKRKKADVQASLGKETIRTSGKNKYAYFSYIT
jgi:hypothetical protein